MAKDRILRVIIAGDAKGALGAFGEVNAGAGGLSGAFGAMGTAAVAGFAVVAAAAVGAGVALFKIGESFDEQYDKIRVGTGATGDQLDALKQNFKDVISDVPTDFGKAGDAITGVTQKLGLTGKPLEDVSEQFLELSRITKTDLAGNLTAGTDALNNWGVAAGNQGAVLDELFRASQQSGESFGDLAAQLAGNGPVLRDLGLNLDQATGLLASLGKAGVDVGDVMPALSKSLATAAKEGKPAGQVFAETFAKIKNAPDDVSAAGEALTVFGAKAGPKLAGLIREGKLSYEQMTAAISSGKDTIIGAGQDTQDFGEKWELIKNRTLVALEPLATKVFDGIGKAMDNLGPIIQNLSVWFSENLPPAVEKVQAVFSAVKDWIDANWPAIQATITTVMQAIQNVTDTVMTAIQGIWDRVGGSITAIVTATFEAIKRIVGDALDIVKGIIDTAMALIHGDWSGVWDGIHATLSAVWDAIVAVVDLGLSLIAGLLDIAWEGIKAAIPAAWDGIKAAIGVAWGLITDGIHTGIDNVVQWFGDMPGRITSAVAGLWDGIKFAFVGVINWIIDRWNGLEFTVPSVDVGPLSFGGQTIGVPDLPHIGGGGGGGETIHAGKFAKGGIVTRPTLALIGEGSEAEGVFPLSRAGDFGFGGGGVTLNVYADMGVDGNRLGQQILEAIEQATRNGVQPGRNTKTAMAS